DHRRAFVEAGMSALRECADRHEQRGEQEREREQLEEDAPPPRAYLLAQSFGGEPLDDAAFPMFFGHDSILAAVDAAVVFAERDDCQTCPATRPIDADAAGRSVEGAVRGADQV